MTHVGGASSEHNPGPGDRYGDIGPIKLPD
jgi:tryptophan 2-monooxygenase